jgi:hypothetical protein
MRPVVSFSLALLIGLAAMSARSVAQTCWPTTETCSQIAEGCRQMIPDEALTKCEPSKKICLSTGKWNALRCLEVAPDKRI